MTETILGYTDSFARRHIGPGDPEIRQMLETLGYDSLDALIDTAIPQSIRMSGALDMVGAAAEYEALQELKEIASRNRVFRSFIGTGYSDCVTPPVILRNILEN